MIALCYSDFILIAIYLNLKCENNVVKTLTMKNLGVKIVVKEQDEFVWSVKCVICYSDTFVYLIEVCSVPQ